VIKSVGITYGERLTFIGRSREMFSDCYDGWFGGTRVRHFDGASLAVTRRTIIINQTTVTVFCSDGGGWIGFRKQIVTLNVSTTAHQEAVIWNARNTIGGRPSNVRAMTALTRRRFFYRRYRFVTGLRQRRTITCPIPPRYAKTNGRHNAVVGDYFGPITRPFVISAFHRTNNLDNAAPGFGGPILRYPKPVAGERPPAAG